jgi:hypothetical protein
LPIDPRGILRLGFSQTRMDWELIVAVTVPFGLTAAALWTTHRHAKAKSEKRQVGYQHR